MGMVSGVLGEALERLQQRGIAIRCHRPRTLMPVLDDTLAFIERHEVVIVVEHNESGQFRTLLQSAGAPYAHLRSVLKYDGTPFLPSQLTGMLEEIIRAETLV